jgi:hypothetical protein
MGTGLMLFIIAVVLEKSLTDFLRNLKLCKILVFYGGIYEDADILKSYAVSSSKYVTDVSMD